MNNSINNRKNVLRTEKKQRKTDSGFISTLFPNVGSIVINMEYKQRGIRDAMPRTVNYFPGSYAYFMVECLNRECIEGGFDFSSVIESMVAGRKQKAKGEFGCQGDASANHSTVDYEVAIEYLK